MKTPTASAACLALMLQIPTHPAQGAGLQFIAPNPATGSSAAVVVPDQPLLLTPQFVSWEKGDITAQANQVFRQLEAALLDAGSNWTRVVKLNVCITDPADQVLMEKQLAALFLGPHKPAVSWVVTALPRAGSRVALDAVATTPPRTGTNDPPALSPPGLLRPGSRIYISGQAERSEDLARATRETLSSLSSTMDFLGRPRHDIVQLKAFLQPMANHQMVRKEIHDYLGAVPVVLVEWRSSTRTPIEIEAVAWGGPARGGSPMEYLTPPGMKASPVYSKIARIHSGPTIFVSGLYARHASPNNDPVASPRHEVRDIFEQLNTILKEGGSDLRHLAKATYYVATPEVSAALNALRPEYYDPRRPPAASKAMVAGTGARDRALTLDMIAVPVAAPPSGPE